MTASGSAVLSSSSLTMGQDYTYFGSRQSRLWPREAAGTKAVGAVSVAAAVIAAAATISKRNTSRGFPLAFRQTAGATVYASCCSSSCDVAARSHPTPNGEIKILKVLSLLNVAVHLLGAAAAKAGVATAQ